jgi:hypothetical protein
VKSRHSEDQALHLHLSGRGLELRNHYFTRWFNVEDMDLLSC